MSFRKSIGFYQPTDRSTDYTGELVNPVTGEVYKPVPRTKQSHMRECDINNIIKDFKVTGQIAHMNTAARNGAYVDLPDQIDFQQSLEVVRSATTSFSTLPSKVRERFGNDPGAFLAFMADPRNNQEIIEMGLATAPEPATPPASPTAAPAATPAPASQAGS